MSGEGSFLSRWSRRKRAAVALPAAPDTALDTAPDTAPPSADAASGAAEAPFDPASLPPVESLTSGSDFAAFLREEVPAALKQAALRRAWTLDPAIRDFVGPADYAWDFNAPGGVPGFALELTGDVKRLLAQAIGLVEDAAEAEAEPDGGEAPPRPQPVLAASTDAVPKVEADAGPAPADAAPVAEAAADALPAPEPPVSVQASLPSRRRHGGALPS